MTRQQVLPYLMKMDLEVGEVDGDMVVEETLVRYRTSHKYCLFQAFHKKPLLGINCWTLHQLKWDPPIRRGSVV